MGRILSIESAVSGFSVAIHEDGQLSSAIQLNNERVASSMLTSAIDQVMNFSEITLSELDAVAVSAGPGSYTGLRVGVSTAKGLCLALDIPLISINTLEVMVNGLELPESMDQHLLCPMIDARRMEVYCSIYEFNNLKMVEGNKAVVVNETTFGPILENGKVVFFGNGAQKILHLYKSHPNAFFLKNTVFPNAVNMGLSANAKLKEREFEDLVSFEPDYLKPYFATKPKNQLSP